MLCDVESIVHLDTEVPDSAFDLRVAEKWRDADKRPATAGGVAPLELVDQCHVCGAAFVVEDAAHVAETDLPVKAQFSVADASQRFQGFLVLGHFPPGRIQRHPPAHQAAKSPPAALSHRDDVGPVAQTLSIADAIAGDGPRR